MPAEQRRGVKWDVGQALLTQRRKVTPDGSCRDHRTGRARQGRGCNGCRGDYRSPTHIGFLGMGLKSDSVILSSKKARLAFSVLIPALLIMILAGKGSEVICASLRNLTSGSGCRRFREAVQPRVRGGTRCGNRGGFSIEQVHGFYSFAEPVPVGLWEGCSVLIGELV